jgi:hypothetical protein
VTRGRVSVCALVHRASGTRTVSYLRGVALTWRPRITGELAGIHLDYRRNLFDLERPGIRTQACRDVRLTVRGLCVHLRTARFNAVAYTRKYATCINQGHHCHALGFGGVHSRRRREFELILELAVLASVASSPRSS